MVILAILWLPIAWLLGQWLVVERPLEKADAIFVLAGSANYVERNQEAARLYNLGVAPKIILSDDHQKGGWDNEKQRNPYFVERAKWLLMENGVPETNIVILPDRVRGTDDEAQALVDYIQTNNTRSMLLLTSAFHTRRTEWIFQYVFNKSRVTSVLGVTYPHPRKGMPPDPLWWTNVDGVKSVTSEYLKFSSFLVTGSLSERSKK